MRTIFTVILSFFLLFLSASQAAAQCAERNVLLEVYTGSWCGWCPDGAVHRDAALASSSRVVAVDLHNSDAMANTDSDTLNAFYTTSYPTGNVDRLGGSISRGIWQTTVDAQLAVESPATVTVSGTYDPASRTISGKVRASFVCSASGDLRFVTMVVEDNVVGTGSGYDQTNYLNTTSGHPYEGAGDPIVGYVHRYVLRDAPLGPFGTAGTIPASVGAGESYEEPFTYVVPAGYDETQLSLVGFVANYGPTDNDRSILNAAQGTLTEGAADHYMAYKVKPSKGRPKLAKFGPVTLTDQFRAAGYEVMKPAQLLLPADKNGEGVSDENTHLAEYKIKAGKYTAGFAVRTGVRIVNQCNDLLVTIKKPVSLLVPTAKDLVAPADPPIADSHQVDHFLCYRAGLQKKLADGTKLGTFPKGMQVEVTDQFQTRRYDLKKITKVCNPVAKSGDPVILAGPEAGQDQPLEPASIRNPENHLVCYLAKPAKKYIEQNGCGPLDPTDKGVSIEPKQAKHTKIFNVNVANQFGRETLDTSKETEFCIPSAEFLD